MESDWDRISAVISDAESGVQESDDQSECGTDDNDHDADESNLTTNVQNAATEDRRTYLDRHAGPTWRSSNAMTSSGEFDMEQPQGSEKARGELLGHLQPTQIPLSLSLFEYIRRLWMCLRARTILHTSSAPTFN